MVRAAVLRQAGGPVRVEEIELAPCAPDQVRVRVAAAGVCHSDLSLARGVLRQELPAVLGHEGAGTVVEAGAAVTRARVGDQVVLCWAPPCRSCAFCQRGEPHLCLAADRDLATSPYATLDGRVVHPMLGTGAFAAETVVSERAVVRIPDDVPMEVAALVGCAVATGVGAVLNTARVTAGSTVVVVGLGGVGLSIIQGARYAGASRIVGVDRSADKLDLARFCGATDALVAGDDVRAAVRGLTGGLGADYAFESVGRADTIRLAWSLTRRGGTTVVVGVGGRDDPVVFSALELFHFARTLVGCVYGSTDPDRDFPRLLEHATGVLHLDRLVTRRIGLAEVGSAFADMDAGRGGRTVVVPD